MLFFAWRTWVCRHCYSHRTLGSPRRPRISPAESCQQNLNELARGPLLCEAGLWLSGAWAAQHWSGQSQGCQCDNVRILTTLWCQTQDTIIILPLVTITCQGKCPGHRADNAADRWPPLWIGKVQIFPDISGQTQKQNIIQIKPGSDRHSDICAWPLPVSDRSYRTSLASHKSQFPE